MLLSIDIRYNYENLYRSCIRLIVRSSTAIKKYVMILSGWQPSSPLQDHFSFVSAKLIFRVLFSTMEPYLEVNEENGLPDLLLSLSPAPQPEVTRLYLVIPYLLPPPFLQLLSDNEQGRH